jgi:hypothetical protein
MKKLENASPMWTFLQATEVTEMFTTGGKGIYKRVCVSTPANMFL